MPRAECQSPRAALPVSPHCCFHRYSVAALILTLGQTVSAGVRFFPLGTSGLPFAGADSHPQCPGFPASGQQRRLWPSSDRVRIVRVDESRTPHWIMWGIASTTVCAVVQSCMTTPRKSTSVPGQALGYSLQYTKMTQLLANSPEGSEVEFEGLDDLSVLMPTGERKLYQTKSALASNPLADRSVAFWKTLANWADVVGKYGWDGTGLSLVIYVTNKVNIGQFAQQCGNAKDDGAVAAVIATIREGLWGTGPGFPERPKVAKELGPHVDRFFGARPEVQGIVVKAMCVETVAADIYTDLESIVRFVDKRRWEDVLKHACGWTKEQVDKLIADRKPAVVTVDAFLQEMTTFIRKFNERAILRTFAPDGPSSTETEQLKLRTFVRQLELIAIDYPDQLQAISDYHRAAIDRTQLGASGEIHPSSLDQLDEQLQRIWKNFSRQKAIQLKGHLPEEVGESVYRECIGAAVPIENQQPQAHFIPGCYHVLADDQRLGWHPKYKELLATMLASKAV